MTGGVGAYLAARVLRLNPTRRVVTVTLKPVGRGQAYAGAYVGATEQLAPVTEHCSSRQIGRVVKVSPTADGAELDMVVADDSAWHSLAAGTASVDALVVFASSGGEPTGGRPVRVEVG